MGIVSYTPDPKKPAKLTAAEKKRLDAMTDDDIDYSDIPDVLSWLKAGGKGYQTRINRH